MKTHQKDKESARRDVERFETTYADNQRISAGYDQIASEWKSRYSSKMFLRTPTLRLRLKYFLRRIEQVSGGDRSA